MGQTKWNKLISSLPRLIPLAGQSFQQRSKAQRFSGLMLYSPTKVPIPRPVPDCFCTVIGWNAVSVWAIDVL